MVGVLDAEEDSHPRSSQRLLEIGRRVDPQQAVAVSGDDAVDRGGHGERRVTGAEADGALGLVHDVDPRALQILEPAIGDVGGVAVPGAARARGQRERTEHVDDERAVDQIHGTRGVLAAALGEDAVTAEGEKRGGGDGAS